MNRFSFLFAVAIALIASNSVFCQYASPQQAVDSLPQQSGDYQLQGVNTNNADSDSASAVASSSGTEAGTYTNTGSAASFGSNQNVPYSTGNTRGNTVTTSITYPQNRGEILIHRPAAIIVKRPPTRVLVNHPPLVVKPAPVVLHKPPAVVLRKVFVKNHPRPVRVEPVYVNVVKPPAEKYFVNERQQQIAGAQLAGVPAGYGLIGGGSNANAAAGGAAANSASGLQNLQNLQDLSAFGGQANNEGGYQLLQGQGLAALAGITGQGNQYAPAGNQYGGQAY